MVESRKASRHMQRDPIIEEKCWVDACRRERGTRGARCFVTTCSWWITLDFSLSLPIQSISLNTFQILLILSILTIINLIQVTILSCLDYERSFPWSSIILSWTLNFHSSQPNFHATARVMYLNQIMSLPCLPWLTTLGLFTRFLMTPCLLYLLNLTAQ